MHVPKRGDLVYINFNPQAGHEQKGRRPAIILSPERFNVHTDFVSVCPITNQSKGYPYEVTIPDGLGISGVILTDQIKNLDWKARKIEIIDEVSSEIVQDCLAKIHTFLS